jgi:myo-inositol 2-dehydrogenase / D-chiro-inositol 1-dehydrogenase
MDKTIRVGMIGAGQIAQSHFEAYAKLPQVKMVAVADLFPEKVEQARQTYGIEHGYADFRQMLQRDDIDAVDVCVHNNKHAPITIAALKAGKHVYCEKPAGIDGPSLRELVRVARSAKTVLTFGQQMRSDERLAATIAKIHEGVAGKIIMLKAQRHAGDDLNHEGSSADWFFNSKKSGDVIVEMAVHNLDVCNWVIGSRPERAGGFGGNLLWKNQPPGRDTMDGYTLSYDYANGVKMSFTQVFFHPNGLPNNGQFFHAYTTEGAVDVMTSTFYPRARGAKPEVLVPPAPRPSAGGAPRPPRREKHITSFYEAIRTGKGNPAGLEVGVTGALTAILGRDAIYSKRVMEWRDFRVEV